MEVRNPEIVTILRTIGTRCPNTRTTWDKWEFRRELPHFMDEESYRGMGFRRELPAHRRRIHQWNRIQPGITRLFTRIQAGKIEMSGKSFEQ
jgi:hypothetical protein